MSLTRTLFKLARVSADLRAVRRGPGAVARRQVNKKKAGLLRKTGFWRWP